jgi:hypothetical protein
MRPPLLLDIVESPLHPDLDSVCRELGIRREVFTLQRKAMQRLKRAAPDVVAADFFYGYGNNYAGANVSNLDVLLRSAERFAPAARLLIFVEPAQGAHLPHLEALFRLDAVVTLPVDATGLADRLRRLIEQAPPG